MSTLSHKPRGKYEFAGGLFETRALWWVDVWYMVMVMVEIFMIDFLTICSDSCLRCEIWPNVGVLVEHPIYRL